MPSGRAFFAADGVFVERSCKPGILTCGPILPAQNSKKNVAAIDQESLASNKVTVGRRQINQDAQ